MHNNNNNNNNDNNNNDNDNNSNVNDNDNNNDRSERDLCSCEAQLQIKPRNFFNAPTGFEPMTSMILHNCEDLFLCYSLYAVHSYDLYHIHFM